MRVTERNFTRTQNLLKKKIASDADLLEAGQLVIDGETPSAQAREGLQEAFQEAMEFYGLVSCQHFTPEYLQTLSKFSRGIWASGPSAEICPYGKSVMVRYLGSADAFKAEAFFTNNGFKFVTMNGG